MLFYLQITLLWKIEQRFILTSDYETEQIFIYIGYSESASLQFLT